MSQSSETTRKTLQLEHLGYQRWEVANSYYTAQLDAEIGVCVAIMLEQWMIQFFPWGGDDWIDNTKGIHELGIRGHQRYARFITSKAASVAATEQKLFTQYPFLQCGLDTDLLTLKCLIEDGRKQIEDQDATHHASKAGREAGEAVE